MLIALARAMLYDPRWPWHAAAQLGASVEAPSGEVLRGLYRAGSRSCSATRISASAESLTSTCPAFPGAPDPSDASGAHRQSILRSCLAA